MIDNFKKKSTPAASFLFAVILILGLVIESATAHAQMMNEPWSFTQQNRASIAALMKQTEKGNSESETTSGGYDQLICGKDGASSATGNSTCIIMNNSDGVIQIGQDAQGNQNATSSTETSTVNAMSDALKSANDADE